jgi:two-component system sensor histidine kinase ChvG
MSERETSCDVNVPSRHRLLSPITRKILAINVLALAIPIGGLLYLGPYKDGLIVSELEALQTESGVFAGAIGESAIENVAPGYPALNLVLASDMIRRLTATTRVRARLFLSRGTLVADSRLLLGSGGVVRVQDLPPPKAKNMVLTPMLGVLDWIAGRVPQHDDYELYHEPKEQDATAYNEVVRALDGEASGRVRIDDDGGLVLSYSQPVQRYRQVLASVMLSKNGVEIEAAVRNVRLAILEIFAGALVITVLLSFYLAGTIARPLRLLAAAALRVRHGLGRESQQIPDLTKRGDEIGELSGVLREMTDALHSRMDAIERFAADVSHEIKNPLTSLRSAVETAARVHDPAQQRQLMSIIVEDVQRLDRLLSAISNASRLDAELSRAELERVDISQMLIMLSKLSITANTAQPRVTVEFAADQELPVNAIGDRLIQVFHNLVDNATSFSPPNCTIKVKASRIGACIEIAVEDEGPGVPEGKLDEIFDRFYTERPRSEKFGTHSGLGLSISKQIIEAHNGTIHAENRYNADGVIQGARLVVRLPSV